MRTIKTIVWVSVFSILMAAHGWADKVVLKDGTIEESERVWESERYIHFILKGTKTVEIRYAKEIVDRIERSSKSEKISPPIESLDAKRGPSESGKTTGLASKGQPASLNMKKTPEAANQMVETPLVGHQQGISLYDPRRTNRYWASKKSQHKSLDGALKALSMQYGRSVKWVVNNMGDQNDLEKIHANLSARRDEEDRDGPDKDLASGQTMAVNTSSRSPALKPSTALKKNPAPEPAIPRGIQFYDPRRDKKYWSSHVNHHQTMKEAFDALAVRYGVSPAWIESHMGETNELYLIHQNIQMDLETGVKP